MKTLSFIIIIILFHSSAAAQWTQTSGPSGGGVSDFAFVGDTILAATFDYANGIYASVDNGSSWQESGLQGIMLNHITAHGDIVIASSTENGYNETDTIYRSSDRGATWQYVQITLKDNSVTSGTIANIDGISSICYHNHEWFIAGEGQAGSMYRSDDDGLTWHFFQPANFSFVYPVTLLSANNNLIAGTVKNGQIAIYYSADGTTFNPAILGNSISGSSELYCGTISANLILFGIDGGIIYSQDGGASWTQPAIDSLKNKTEYIAHLAGSGNNIIAISSQNRIFVSHNGAQNWSLVSGNGLPINASYFFSVGYDANRNTIYLGTSAGILSQSTLSNSWNYSTQGLRAASLSDLAEYQGTLFAATERGVSFTSNQGNSWHDPQNLADLEDIRLIGFSEGSNNLYSYGEGIYKWNGTNWSTLDTGHVTAFTEASGRLFACRDTGDPISGASRIEYSDNGGASWNVPLWFPNSFDSEFYFMPRSIVPNGNGTIIAIQRAISYFAFLSDYFVYRSIDNGVTWSKTGTVYKPAVLYYAGNEYYLGTIGHGIYHSVDDGLSWSQLPGIPDGADVTSILKINNSLFISVTGNGYALDGLFFSNDDGTSWHYDNYGKTNIFGPLAEDGTYLFSGGPSVWRRQLQGLDVKNKQTAGQEDILRFYPNPAGDQLHVHFNSNASEGTLIIYDEKGIAVSRYAIANAAEDNSISLEGLSEGDYFAEYVDRSNSLISSSRFVIQRK